jgi:hypothetical protein
LSSTHQRVKAVGKAIAALCQERQVILQGFRFGHLRLDLPPGAIGRGVQPLNPAFRLMRAGIEPNHQRLKRGSVALQHTQRPLQPDCLDQGSAEQHDKNEFEGPFHGNHRAG